MILPSGLAGGLVRLRDLLLRTVARRRHIVVPSLLADRGPEASSAEPEPGPEEPPAVEDAPTSVTADDVAGATEGSP